MPEDFSSEQLQQDEPENEFVEVDPTGRYGRYSEILGKGAFKTVYKAFDEWEGIEVAWNQVKVADVLRNSDDLERLYSEVELLQTLKHKNIIKFYGSWVDTENNNINFITEVFTSGTLRQYRRKHKHVDLRALKNWSRQILSGLLYLHSHNPPVIHRDLKCDNLFVNGNQGEVKIGDLGLAAILRHANSAHSVIGTPEFMAPELYEEEYNELVDIYAFGMCLLELVTFEYPYIECSNAAQIFKKVTSGIKPASLAKVQDPGVKEFIEKCIANASERLPARELLMDPFLRLGAENENISHNVPSPNYPDSINQSSATTVDEANRVEPSMAGLDFTLEGQRKDVNTIFLKLRIADSTGQMRNIHFPFDIEADTSISVATEMVSELDLTDQDVTAIAAMIDAEIQAHVPEWMPGEVVDNRDTEDIASDNHNPEAEDGLSPLRNESDPPSGNLVLERLPSGRKYWADSPRGSSGDSPSSHTDSNASFEKNTHVRDDLLNNSEQKECLSHGSCSPNQRVNFQECDSHRSSSPEQQNNLPFSGTVHQQNISLNDEQKNYHSHGSSSLDQQNNSPHCTHKGDNNFKSTSTSASPGLQDLSSRDTIHQNHEEDPTCVRCQSGEDQQRTIEQHEHDVEHMYEKLLETESEDVKSVIQKLEILLDKQRRELDDLKRKHDMDKADVLKELPVELHTVVLNMCQSI